MPRYEVTIERIERGVITVDEETTPERAIAEAFQSMYLFDFNPLEPPVYRVKAVEAVE